MLRIRHDLALRRHDQRPGQFGRCRGRADAFGNGDAQFGGGGHVDVAGQLACLRNQFQIRQFRQQRAVEAVRSRISTSASNGASRIASWPSPPPCC
jgi:hypothetical protein